MPGAASDRVAWRAALSARWPGALIVAVACLVCLGFRLARLEADAPERYPNGAQARELWAEGPAKAHEARRYANYGTLATRAEDNYRIWSVQSPAYVYPLALALRLFGASWASLRVFGALAAAVGVLALYALCRARGSRLGAAAACLIAALSYFATHLSRGGLIEPYLNVVSTIAVLAAVGGQRRLVWMVAAELVFAAAVLTKQSALALFPALLAAGVAAHVAAWRRGDPVRTQLAAFGAAILAGGALTAYVLSAAYWQTVEWNFGHMVVGVEQRQRLTAGALHASNLVSRLLDGARWRDAVLYVTPLFPLAFGHIVAIAIDRWRARTVHPVDWISGLWLAGVVVSLLLTEHVRPRFSIVLLPPVAVLAGGCIARLARSPRGLLRWGAPAAAACVVVLTDVRWNVAWLAAPTYELRDAGRRLARELRHGDVVAGFRAPALAFDTPADVFYVKAHFNTEPQVVRALGFTHVLADAKDAPAHTVLRGLGTSLRSATRVTDVRVNGRRATLYRLPAASRTGPTATTATTATNE